MTNRIESLAHRKGYHHGNLEDSLIEAARRLVAEKGPSAFTLADAARLAGVTPAAVYRHFADRTALLGALAGRGYVAFEQALRQALEGHSTPLEGFTAMGDAYLAFAREEPGYYAAMFSSGLRNLEVKVAGPNAFEALIEGITAALPLSRERAVPLGMQIWSLSHGVATLDAGGMFDAEQCPTTAQETLRAGALALLRNAMGGER